MKKEINLSIKEIEIIYMGLIRFEQNLTNILSYEEQEEIIKNTKEKIENSKGLKEKLSFILKDLSCFGDVTDSKKEKEWETKKRLEILKLEKEIKLSLEFK